jgi:hypothetical protein
MNPTASSHVGEAVSTNDSHILLTGTFNNVGPGIESFFLVKSQLNCFSNLNLTIGIEETNSNEETSNIPFPNPTSGSFNINLSIEPELIELIDLTGKNIPFSQIYHAGILSIDAGSIAPGMYFLKLRTNQNSPALYQSIIISR